MPKIDISEEILNRIAAFKPVVEAVIEEEISLDTCIEVILIQGIDAVLAELMAPLDPETLLKAWQQLASQYPDQVYQHVAETLKSGTAIQAAEGMRWRLGFSVPDTQKD